LAASFECSQSQIGFLEQRLYAILIKQVEECASLDIVSGTVYLDYFFFSVLQ